MQMAIQKCWLQVNRTLLVPDGNPTAVQLFAAKGAFVSDASLAGITNVGAYFKSVATTEIRVAGGGTAIVAANPPGPLGGTPPAASDAMVSGSGTPVCHGLYQYDAPSGNWIGNAGFMMAIISDYPNPGDSNWGLIQGNYVYYVAPETLSPWTAVWVKASFGAAPVPVVVAWGVS